MYGSLLDIGDGVRIGWIGVGVLQRLYFNFGGFRLPVFGRNGGGVKGWRSVRRGFKGSVFGIIVNINRRRRKRRCCMHCFCYMFKLLYSLLWFIMLILGFVDAGELLVR
jgi:hypothetical protein